MHEKLKSIMSQKNLSQGKLAMLSGIAVTSFNQAYNGKIPFYPSWRKQTAAALNMPEYEVFPEYAQSTTL